MLSNAYFLAKFRFDTAENEPAKNLQKFGKVKSNCFQNSGKMLPILLLLLRSRGHLELRLVALARLLRLPRHLAAPGWCRNHQHARGGAVQERAEILQISNDDAKIPLLMRSYRLKRTPNRPRIFGRKSEQPKSVI